MFQKKVHFILSGWDTVHKSLSGTYSRSTYFSSLLGREDRGGVCIRKVRESLPFHSLGTHQFTVQILSRNTVLKSTAICYNRINSHQNSFILWRWSCDYMKEEPIHSVGEWTAYFQWLPRSTRKHWSLYWSLCEPLQKLRALCTV